MFPKAEDSTLARWDFIILVIAGTLIAFTVYSPREAGQAFLAGLGSVTALKQFVLKEGVAANKKDK